VLAEFLTKFPRPLIKFDADGNAKFDVRPTGVILPLDALRFLLCSAEFIEVL
jgi:hypothetical protein